MSPESEVAALVQALQQAGAPIDPLAFPALEQALALATEGRAWALPPGVFGQTLARVVATELDPPAALAGLHHADLYLASGCAHGDPLALAEFEHTLGPEIGHAIRKTGVEANKAQDLRQQILQKLFVAAPDSEPAIARYSGRGSLRSWIRMTAVRTLIDAGRVVGHRREVPSQTRVIDALLQPEQDPELAYLKDHYRAEFEACVTAALDQLEPRARTVLKYSIADGLPIDDIGELYGVHRATAARWVAKARDAFVLAVREQLARRFSVSAPEFASILRLVRSRVELDFGA